VGETQEEKKDSEGVELGKAENEWIEQRSNLSLDSCNRHMKQKKEGLEFKKLGQKEERKIALA
jgi:hypothetical protein